MVQTEDAHFLVPGISRSDNLHFFLWGLVKGNVEVPTVACKQKNLKGQILRAIAKWYQYLLQNICYHVAYFIDVGRETANPELA
jgi:hypothetical protein